MTHLLKYAVGAGALLAAAGASAQVTNIATLDTLEAIANAKALNAAGQAISTQFASTGTLIQQKQQQLEPLIARMDTNKDGNIDQREFDAAKKSKVVAVKQAATQAESIQKEIQTLNQPEALARLYALEQLLTRFEAAQNKVVADRRIGAILNPSAFIYSPPAADITAHVTAELDRTVTSLPTAPPANWRPRQQTVQAMEQLVQLQNIRAYMQAAQAQRQQQQGQAARPATGTPAPAAGTPATQPQPQTPRPAPQPQGR